MTQDQRPINLLVRYQTDAASAKQTEDAAKAIEQRFKSLADTASQLRLSAEQVKQLTVATERLEASSRNVAPLGGMLNKGDLVTAQKFMSELEQIQAREAAQAKEQLATERQITTELQKQAGEAAKTTAAGASGGAGGRTLGQSVTKAGRELFMLPDVGPSTDISRGLILGGAAIDRFNINTKQLAIGMPIAGAAMVGLSIAADFVRDSTEAARDRQKRYGEALLEAAKAAETATTTQIQAQIASLEQDNRIKQAAIGNILELTGLSQDVLNSLSRTELKDFSFAGIVENLLAAAGGVSENAEQVKQWSGDIDKNTFLIAALRDILNEGGAAANDAAVALREHVDAMRSQVDQIRDAARQNAEAEADTRVRLAGIRRNGTTEQVQSELQANQDRMSIIQNYLIPGIDELGLSAEETEKRTKPYTDELRRLLQTNDLLLNQVLPIVEAREREAAALKEQLGIINDSIGYSQQLAEQIRTATVEGTASRLHALQEEYTAIQTFLPQLQELAPTSKAAADELLKAQTRLGRIGDDFGDLVTRVLPAALARAQQAYLDEAEKARAASQAKIEQIQTEQGEKETAALLQRTDDERKLREKSASDLKDSLAKIEKDSNKRILEIRLNGTRDILRAIARGDQAAAIERLEDQQDAIKKEQAQRTDAEQEQKTQTDKRLREQLQTIKERYDDQVRAARDAAEKSIRQERERLRVELNEKAAAYQQQLALLDAFRVSGTNQIAMFVNGANAELARLRVPSLPATASYVPAAQVQDPRYANTSQFPTVTSILEDQARRNAGVTNSIDARLIRGGFDKGGYNTMPGYYWSGLPEVHIPMTDVNRFVDGYSGGSARPLTVNVYPSPGMNEAQLAQLVVKKIKEQEPAMTQRISSNMGMVLLQERRRRFNGSV